MVTPHLLWNIPLMQLETEELVSHSPRVIQLCAWHQAGAAPRWSLKGPEAISSNSRERWNSRLLELEVSEYKKRHLKLGVSDPFRLEAWVVQKFLTVSLYSVVSLLLSSSLQCALLFIVCYEVQGWQFFLCHAQEPKRFWLNQLQHFDLPALKQDATNGRLWK